MAIAARLYQDDRTAERFRVDFDATLRDSAHLPLDVVVEDLSATGFRVVTPAPLAVGDEIGLGLAGIGTHRALIVWSRDGVHGCEFLKPLDAGDLQLALSAPSADPVAFPTPMPWSGSVPVKKGGLGPRGRLFSIIAAAIVAWVAAIALGTVVVRTVSALMGG